MSNHDPESKELPPPPAARINSPSYPHVYPSYPYTTYYKDTSEKRRISWLVPVLVVAQIVFFVMVMFINNCPDNYESRGSLFGPQDRCVARYLGRFSFQPWKENPLLGPSTPKLIKVGALDWWRVVHGSEPWRLVSAIWLHAGLIHLFVNLLSVIFIGIRLEQQFGFLRVGIVYVLSGFGGCLLGCIFLRGNVSVGASAPLFGLLGAMLAELLINCSIYTNKVAAIFTLVVVGAINAALGILPRVGNFANIGGFGTGFLLGFILLIRPQHGWAERKQQPVNTRLNSKYKPYQYILWLVALILLIAGLAVGIAVLFIWKNGYNKCSWCHYLNCVPTSKWRCDAWESIRA